VLHGNVCQAFQSPGQQWRRAPCCQQQQSTASDNESFFRESRRLTRPSRFSNMRPKRTKRFPLASNSFSPYDIAYSDTVALNLEAPVAFNLGIDREIHSCRMHGGASTGPPTPKAGALSTRTVERSPPIGGPQLPSTTSLDGTPPPRNALGAPPTCGRRILMHRVVQSPVGLVF